MANDTKQYIKKINMPISGTTTPLYVRDDEAAHSVNGYEKAAIEAQTVTFANLRIDETTDIDPLFAASTDGGNN